MLRCKVIAAIRALRHAVAIGPLIAAGAAVGASRIAVLPLAGASVSDSDAYAFSAAIRAGLAEAGWDAVNAAEIDRALKAAGCAQSDTCAAAACALTVADSLGADAALAGTISVHDGVTETRLHLYATSSRSAVWAKGYRSKDGLAALRAIVPAKVAAALPHPFAPQTDLISEEAPTRPIASDSEETASRSSIASEAGIPAVTQSPLIGIQGIATLGEAKEAQSRGGGFAFFAYPTTPQSYMRAKIGVPLYHNRSTALSSDGKLPDPYISLEHQWGWPTFAIGFGLAYMYLNQFEINAVESVYFSNLGSSRMVDVHAHYESSHALAVCASLRGGKPNAGFYGRIAWPLPYLLYDDAPNQFFFEYSALGVYGRKSVKAGLGITGMIKARGAEYVIAEGRRYDFVNKRSRDDEDLYASSSPDYSDFSSANSIEFFTLMPCLKVAGLIGKHIVLTGIVDLGGTILPRIIDSGGENWKPSLGVSLAYSFGELTEPNAMDGTF